jgi:hypothetical protein
MQPRKRSAVRVSPIHSEALVRTATVTSNGLSVVRNGPFRKPTAIIAGRWNTPLMSEPSLP